MIFKLSVPQREQLRVDGFNQQVKTPLDEWIAFLKTGEIDKNSTVQGLKEARERLRLDQLGRKTVHNIITIWKPYATNAVLSKLVGLKEKQIEEIKSL